MDNLVDNDGWWRCDSPYEDTETNLPWKLEARGLKVGTINAERQAERCKTNTI